MDIDAASFFKLKKMESSILSMTGTGVNGGIQVPILAEVGAHKINNLKKVNVISGSTYSYFILQSYQLNMLREDLFVKFEKLNRDRHKSSFVRSLAKVIPVIFLKKSFFVNEALDTTTEYMFKKDYCETKLKDLPDNVSFWSYCQKRNQNIEISTQKGFGDISVKEIIRACISIRFFHGAFEYKGYSFVDPNFVKSARRQLVKTILSEDGDHLVVNAYKGGQRGRVNYIKHTRAKNPSLEIMKDILFFAFNIKNSVIDNTHINGLQQLKRNEGSYYGK